MTQKNMMYDHPAYIARLCHSFGANAAGASSVTAKFVAFTNLHVFSIGATSFVVGTSTYTAWNGTATVTTTGTGDLISGIKVSGTATSTYGPYALSAAQGGFSRVQISGTGIGSSTADGGVALAAGDTFHLVRGTDATAVEVTVLEFGVDPFASVTA
jgi:NAD(P)H-hydrate repair Nnr-like enzyme with NAD(P)H-hydrate dehydratase domain